MTDSGLTASAATIAHAAEREDMPAWSLPADAAAQLSVATTSFPEVMTRDWAWGESTGAGVKVCILDSGIQPDHPMVGTVEESYAVTVGEDGEPSVDADSEGDLCGHGTACGGIVRSLAPDATLVSVRVLGAGYTGSGKIMLAGLRWSIEQGFDVVNMSLSTTKREFSGLLHELADTAYFRRTVLVASAHNMPVESYPWRFSSVISVGSHEESDPLTFYANPSPPVEFFARGFELDVAWMNGSTIRATGNSFATPHISGIAALIMAKHPGLTPFQLKSLLYLTASNVGGNR